MSDIPSDERPTRGCDSCHQTDNHPRHVIQYGPDQFTVKHIDCCAAEGCRICLTTESITQGVRGDELFDVIRSGVLNEVDV